MNESVTNEQVIQAVFTATDEAKEHALAILEGRALPALSEVEGSDNPLLLRMGEAAEMLNVSRATLWRTIKAGSLEKVELYPGSFRLRRADVVALVGKKAVHCG